MGFYINPPADGFAEILKDGLYVDKSELIAYTNQVLGTSKKLTCFSRPRRFGKSFATKMLVAYYSRGADARALFENLKIAGMKDAGFEKHLNQYHVLSLDITSFISVTQNVDNTVLALQKDVIEELAEAFPGCIKPDTTSLFKALSQVNARTGEKFFIIIDEWDALFREAKNNRRLQESYLQLLRSLFKSNQTSQVILGAYMTGILPIKKYGTQSALTDFYEFTMLEPGPLAQFAGFTESEVRSLCQKHDLDFEKAQSWYDGYHFPGMEHIYNPNSIIKAIFHHKFGNYWTQTETYESLKIYIDLNQDGLRDSIVDMLGKKRCRIDIGTFQNDMTSLKNKDDIFTLLVHLGYLAYESDSRSVFIPNEEIREEFIRAVKNGSCKDRLSVAQKLKF